MECPDCGGILIASKTGVYRCGNCGYTKKVRR